VGGDAEVEKAAAIVADQEEDVEGLEGQGLNHEEIGSPDGLGVVGKEGTPALAGRPGWPPASVTANGACAAGDAELEQLATDPLGAPVRTPPAPHTGRERLHSSGSCHPTYGLTPRRQ
jgi:hypothetical protein